MLGRDCPRHLSDRRICGRHPGAAPHGGPSSPNRRRAEAAPCAPSGAAPQEVSDRRKRHYAAG
eukprot:14097277-Heterocapsa_arctica.AAC.1